MRSALLLIGVLLCPLSQAERVQVPLFLDHQFIESWLREQVFTGDRGSLRLNDDGSGCQYLELSEPRVSSNGGSLLLQVAAEARAGRMIGNQCLLVLDWRGGLELVQNPQVGDDGESVLLHTSSWRALRPDGTTDSLSTTIGGWLEQFLPVDLRQARISFAEPLGQLEDFLSLVVRTEDAAGTRALLDSLAIDDVAARDSGAAVTLGIDVPPPGPTAPRVEPALTAAEIARLEQQLDVVDAFFTYTIKSVAAEPEATDSAALLEVLIELRRELVAILGERQPGGDDPARSLFVHAWSGLVPVLRAIAAEQAEHASAMQYLTFISAGDALRVLDELGPAAGIEVSSDGLRRLARILIPDDGTDPLARDDAVDPALRRSLGFDPPLPMQLPLPPPPHFDETSWIDWFVPRVVAAEPLEASVVKRLNNWVPATKDMAVYLPMAEDVLHHVAAAQLLESELDGAFHDVFESLVFATAWQESCWRQFVAENDMRVPMQSASGDLGMMQVNPVVWRGFYDLHGLRWDIVYNAGAGADILEHYMIDYAIRHREHETTGSIDNLARSTYAAYNGGPRQYDRYRRADASARGRKVDALFYEKYREVRSGKELPVTACYVDS